MNFFNLIQALVDLYPTSDSSNCNLYENFFFAWLKPDLLFLYSTTFLRQAQDDWSWQYTDNITTSDNYRIYLERCLLID